MTREEAINHLKDILAEATETEDAVCYVTNEDAEALEMAIEALKEQQWIPVKERLPEETGKYLITEEDGEVCVDTYLVKHNEWYRCFPIAWMPLPEPMRVEKES